MLLYPNTLNQKGYHFVCVDFGRFFGCAVFKLHKVGMLTRATRLYGLGKKGVV